MDVECQKLDDKSWSNPKKLALILAVMLSNDNILELILESGLGLML